MSATDENAALRRGIRTDLVIAVCALLVSALATAASWWQSHVVAEQLSSQVWPYLTFSTTYDPQYVSFEVDNDGLGPAIIRSAVLTIDGKPYADPVAAFRRVFTRPKHGHFGARLSGISPGSVIRAGGATRLFRLDGDWAVRQFAAATKAGRFDFRVCYCSLLGNCWLVSAKQQTEDPQAVRVCPPGGADQYHVGVGTAFLSGPVPSGAAPA
jgi:hypothetical protein